MQALRDDGSLLRKAASDASKAVSYMQDMQQQQPTALAA
jgi:antirestriction protein ArdC